MSAKRLSLALACLVPLGVPCASAQEVPSVVLSRPQVEVSVPFTNLRSARELGDGASSCSTCRTEPFTSSISAATP